MIVPHPPFVFDENGDSVAPDQTGPREGYINQVRFINKSLLPGLKTLVEKSANLPVIILQGDHGAFIEADATAEVKILNAYYLPAGADLLYPTISPVNSFRVVFNSYFGADFPLLEDTSYYSDRKKIFDFRVVPNSCP